MILSNLCRKLAINDDEVKRALYNAVFISYRRAKKGLRSNNMHKEQEHTLNAIRECLANNMPTDGKAILFGSQARGTARDDSDWDILIILDKEELLPSDYDNVTYPLTELGWELGKEINPVMYSAKEWLKYKNTSFCKNVEKEGIRL
jgi:predicted nucleotidyltransferase